MFKSSKLYDQETFYDAFTRDLRHSKHEVIIESPFITTRRTNALLPILAKLRKRNVTIIVNTRDPTEHSGNYYRQALDAIEAMQDLGIIVLYTTHHHRKLVILDRRVFYEGSLNILSFSNSCEIMRRVVSSVEAKILINFIGVKKYARRKY